MIKFTIGQIVSAIIAVGFVYLVMDSANFATSKTVIGKVGDMVSAIIVWFVMIRFAAKDLFDPIYTDFVSRFIK